MSKVLPNYICLAINFVLKKNENYYLQVFLRAYKYTEKGKINDETSY